MAAARRQRTERENGPGMLNYCSAITGGQEGMGHEKNFKAWKRQHRRRKSAKAKMKLYEQGKLAHDQLPALAKDFVARKRRFLLKSA
jgi:hypothetical protein